MTVEITEHTLKTDRHITGYLAAGPADGPLIFFIHGWPELSISWRHQIPVFAGLGFRVIAPDMRGYGRSSTYSNTEAFTQEQIVADMVELHAHVSDEAAPAVWVGHDWGSPVVWNLASHHPELCRGVASLCVPYATLERGFDNLVSLVDRNVYPKDEFPVGQWDYMLYYLESLPRAVEVFEANTYQTVKALFRKGNPDGRGKPAGTSMVRAGGGWLGGVDEFPDLPRDEDVVTEADLRFYAAALDRNGFFGPDAWYMNHDANTAFYQSTQTGDANNGMLNMPVLFLHGLYDYTCETTESGLADPMRALCPNLTEATLETGHWMAQERPAEVNAHLARWLMRTVGT
ncbi:MAG: pimeloyl-ACP methyl ester carboxylesterase [Candidatus Poriferisodalaceae bacterium]|jgi:pimeloyl-ACP methyl ester carboxylesterase